MYYCDRISPEKLSRLRDHCGQRTHEHSPFPPAQAGLHSGDHPQHPFVRFPIDAKHVSLSDLLLGFSFGVEQPTDGVLTKICKSERADFKGGNVVYRRLRPSMNDFPPPPPPIPHQQFKNLPEIWQQAAFYCRRLLNL